MIPEERGWISAAIDGEGYLGGSIGMKIVNIEFEKERIVGIEFDCGCYFCKSDEAVHECHAHTEIAKK